MGRGLSISFWFGTLPQIPITRKLRIATKNSALRSVSLEHLWPWEITSRLIFSFQTMQNEIAADIVSLQIGISTERYKKRVGRPLFQAFLGFFLLKTASLYGCIRPCATQFRINAQRFNSFRLQPLLMLPRILKVASQKSLLTIRTASVQQHPRLKASLIEVREEVNR